MPDEDTATRLKRLHMRSIRRGIKEMDIILSRFAGERLAGLDASALDTYEDLLSENDQDLYQWVTGQRPPPTRYAGLIDQIEASATPAK